MEYAVRYLRLSLTIACLVAAAIALGTATLRNPADEQRGLILPTWQVHGYRSTDTTQALDGIASVGANWVQFVPFWYQATLTSNTIGPTDHSVSDNDVRNAVSLAHTHGLKVLLKPAVDLAGDQHLYRGNINPTNRADWFASYQSFIVHYAGLAQQSGVDQFAVGTELASMSGSGDRSRWLTAINAIKAQYHGPLVYAANYDEYRDVSFWDVLDLVGIDGYWPLSQTPTANVSQLEQAFAPIRDALRAFAARVGRRILFTEAGYPAQVGAAVAPTLSNNCSTPAQDEQAAAYQALFATFSGQPWWAGVFWWSWWTTTGVYDPLDHAVHGKLAESVLRRWWAGLDP
jgi:hypothetical protein